VVSSSLRALSVQDGGLGLFRLVHLLDALSNSARTERIISVGSGKGYHEIIIARLLPEAAVVALDIESQDLEFHPENLESLSGDILSADFAGSLGIADFVYSIECLEHIEQDGAAFKAMSQLVSESGCLYLQVPFACTAERSDPEIRQRELESYGHCTPGYDAAQLRSLCAANGLDCLAVKNVFWAPLQPMLWAAVERFGADFVHLHIGELLTLLESDRRDVLANDRSQCTGIKVLAARTPQRSRDRALQDSGDG
jgi:SAM-dependent methyltransferase